MGLFIFTDLLNLPYKRVKEVLTCAAPTIPKYRTESMSKSERKRELYTVYVLYDGQPCFHAGGSQLFTMPLAKKVVPLKFILLVMLEYNHYYCPERLLLLSGQVLARYPPSSSIIGIKKVGVEELKWYAVS